jgi:hypothetical protein
MHFAQSSICCSPGKEQSHVVRFLRVRIYVLDAECRRRHVLGRVVGSHQVNYCYTTSKISIPSMVMSITQHSTHRDCAGPPFQICMP